MPEPTKQIESSVPRRHYLRVVVRQFRPSCRFPFVAYWRITRGHSIAVDECKSSLFCDMGLSREFILHFADQCCGVGGTTRSYGLGERGTDPGVSIRRNRV